PNNFPDIGRDEVADKLLHVVVYRPSLLHGSHDGGEVVISQDHLRGGFSHRGARAHGNADFRFLQSRSIIHTVSSLKG
ncbi:hypothetical protein DBR06_SOUSAS810118, partial [Sousa chinensis]